MGILRPIGKLSLYLGQGILLSGFLGCIGLATTQGIASIYLQSAIICLQDPTLSFPTWQNAVRDLRWAQQLDYRNPMVFIGLGKAYFLQAQQISTEKEKQKALGLALSYYQQSAKQQPRSAYTWANIALLRYQLSPMDPAINKALNQAITLAPWTPEVQLIVISVGLSNFYGLPTTTQKKVLDTVDRGFRIQPEATQAIIEQTQQTVTLCSQAMSMLSLKYFCQQQMQFF